MQPVLVVDDDPGTRDSFSAILQLEGIPAVTASTAEEGLITASLINCGLILADLRLPRRTGIDLVTDLRARGVSTPVVIITAYATTPHVVAAIRAGAVDCLEKPIDEVTLLRVVRERLRPYSTDLASDGSLASRALTLIGRDFQRPDLTAGAVARQLGVSVEHLCRAFKSRLSTTPGAAIRGARVAHAQSLLRETNQSVKEVAFACGFRSVQQLDRALKRHTGLTPTEQRGARR